MTQIGRLFACAFKSQKIQQTNKDKNRIIIKFDHGNRKFSRVQFVY